MAAGLLCAVPVPADLTAFPKELGGLFRGTTITVVTEHTRPRNAIATDIIAIELGRLTTVEYASMKQCADAIT